MKHFVNKIAVFLLAFLIFFVGTGVTVIDLCCQNCIEHTLSLSDVSCCSQTQHSHSDATAAGHNHDSYQHEDICSSPHEGECCVPERISFDIDHFFSKPQIVAPFVWIANNLFENVTPVLNEAPTDNVPILRDKIPIIVHPRVYLSMIRILII
ncbi:hypothetical protein M2132_001132 [Dysgonomonas sp. PH5-45]|uniref:hypothetical protein n=1 Tax=unclassified Dysgonomonas TaxID=2630389 RepID=UPI002474F608|nr:MULTISPECIES: hypothetical protein [unclassified Dysgonomonas]MDH6354801.1 hypothetical protein [Dysgonomonas sp. PH5-45]MDH6387700.1 hypothetical protein [Dysgonomonas sp. PH5-37]